MLSTVRVINNCVVEHWKRGFTRVNSGTSLARAAIGSSRAAHRLRLECTR